MVLQALPTKIRLSWDALPGTNALACYEHAQLTAVKSFITLALGVNVMKTFYGHKLRMFEIR
jgi:hypothetical protein